MLSIAQRTRISALALILLVFVLALARPAHAQISVTVVMRSGERHTGRNPTLTEDGEFGLRRSQGEFHVKASDIAYVDFVEGKAPPARLETTQAVVLRDGTVVAGRLVEMGHLMHDDETTDYVVTLRDARGELQRVQGPHIARVYFSAVTGAKQP